MFINMINSIKDEDIELLKNYGFVEYQKVPVSKWILPDTYQYKLTNAAMFAVLLGTRIWAKRVNGPTLPSTLGLLALPLLWRADKRKIDVQNYLSFDRNDFQKNLEFSPITRNAWIEALIENKKYNEALKKKIEELEKLKGPVADDDAEESQDNDSEDNDEDEDEDDE